MSMSSDELAALLTAPALEAPDGVVPNFDNPPNDNGLAWFVTTFCTVVLTVFLVVRLYAKVWIARRIRAEEVLMVLAYGAYWGTAYAGYAMIYAPGYYVHQWNLRNGDLVHPLYLILIYGCSYSAVLPLLKTAILLDWCRIFVAVDRFKSFFWWGCIFTIFVQVSWGIACIILLNMQCVPHEAIWMFYLPSRCYDLNKVMLMSGSVQVFTDWCMVLLPQRIIWGLQMNWQKKVGVAIIFGVGVLASISATVRLSTTITFSEEDDTMYYIGPLLFWACAEMTCGFFILCVPCLPVIIKESGLSNIAKIFSVRTDSSAKASNHGIVTFGGTGPTSLSKKSKNLNDSYYKMDEDDGGMVLDDREATESQERLHVRQGNTAAGVMRTTEVTVTSDSRSGHAQTGGQSGVNDMPWAR